MNKKYIKVSNAFQLASVIAIYAIQFGIYLPMRYVLWGESGTDINFYFIIWCSVIALVLGIAGLIFSIVAGVLKESPTPGFSLALKALLIPFFLVNFTFWAFFVLGTLNPFLFVATPFVIVIGVTLTYLVVLMTSLPIVIFTLIELRLYKNCPKTLFILGIIFSFFFVLDVVGVFLLVLAYKKCDRGG